MPVTTIIPRFWRTLCDANKRRAVLYPGNDRISLSFRSNELAGEVGEFCNMVKKVERHELQIAGKSLDIHGSYEDREKLLLEIGDVLISLALVCNHLRIGPLEIEDATARAFNNKSRDLGLFVFISAGGDVVQ